MFYAFISEDSSENQYFETLQEARHHLEHFRCVETPYTYDSERLVNDNYEPCLVRCFAKESDLPDDFDDLQESEQERLLDEAVGDGAYCPCICEFSGNLSDYFED